MAENAQEGLKVLLDALHKIYARDVAEEITTVIARGAIEESAVKGQLKELSQRPLDPDEAYKVALEMLIASLEPLLMQTHLLNELTALMDKKAKVVWLQDFVEKSPIEPERQEYIIDIPYIEEDVHKLGADLKRFLALLEED